MKTLLRLSLVALLAVLASCRSTRINDAELPLQTGGRWAWDDARDAKLAKEPMRVEVVLSEQKAHFYRGDEQVGWSYVATGIAKYPTPKGSFTILERASDKHSNLYGKIYDASGKCVEEDAKMGRDPIPAGGKFEGARMAYWMRITEDGVGMHVGPIPHPGQRASHGCIRLPREAAAKIFNSVRRGTSVAVIQNRGEKPPAYVAPKPKTETPKPAATAAAKPAASKPAAASPSPAAASLPPPTPPPAAAAPSVPQIRPPSEPGLPLLPGSGAR